MIDWFMRQEGSLQYYLNVNNLELEPILLVNPAELSGAFSLRLVSPTYLYVGLF
jgi:hypothetical protein